MQSDNHGYYGHYGGVPQDYIAPSHSHIGVNPRDVQFFPDYMEEAADDTQGHPCAAPRGRMGLDMDVVDVNVQTPYNVLDRTQRPDDWQNEESDYMLLRPISDFVAQSFGMNNFGNQAQPPIGGHSSPMNQYNGYTGGAVAASMDQPIVSPFAGMSMPFGNTGNLGPMAFAQNFSQHAVMEVQNGFPGYTSTQNGRLFAGNTQHYPSTEHVPAPRNDAVKMEDATSYHGQSQSPAMFGQHSFSGSQHLEDSFTNIAGPVETSTPFAPPNQQTGRSQPAYANLDMHADNRVFGDYNRAASARFDERVNNQIPATPSMKTPSPVPDSPDSDANTTASPSVPAPGHHGAYLSCPICGPTRCTTETSLKRHIDREHIKVQVFECSVKNCLVEYDDGTAGPYRTKKESDLKRHKIDAHSQEKNFSCPACQHKFKRADNCRRHIRNVHGSEAEPEHV